MNEIILAVVIVIITGTLLTTYAFHIRKNIKKQVRAKEQFIEINYEEINNV